MKQDTGNQEQSGQRTGLYSERGLIFLLLLAMLAGTMMGIHLDFSAQRREEAAVTELPTEAAEAPEPTVPLTTEPAAVRQEKLSYRFPMEGKPRHLDGEPQVRPVPGEYSELARSYSEFLSAETIYTHYCKAITCDVDGNGIQELILVYPMDGEVRPYMACSVYTLKDGYPTALVEDFFISSVTGNCNGGIYLLEKNGAVYLGLDNYGEPDGLRAGELVIYEILDEYCTELLSIQYEWQGEPEGYCLYRTLYDQSRATINGIDCSYEDFEDLWDQMNVLYEYYIYSYDSGGEPWEEFTGYDQVEYIPIDWER